MIRELFKKVFDIRDGEIYLSFLMQLYVFLLISALLIVKPTVSALFLSEYGADNLPYGYLLVALVAVLSSYFYNHAIRNNSLKSITVTTLIFFSVSFAVLGGLLYFSNTNGYVFYYYYINVSLFAVITTSQFWILANMIYNAREAKRLFGFIGSGAIAGGIFGGYVTTLIAPVYGNKALLILAAILIVCCIPILYKVWNLRIRKLSPYTRKQRKNTDNKLLKSSFKLIKNSNHLTYLACITGVSVIIAKLVDFQFSDFAHRAISNSDELASFFGFWFSSFNVIALLIQLFFTNKVLGYLGVSSTLLILPIGIALGSLLFLTFPELSVLIIIKGLDGSFKQSINKAATELSILPIPNHIKNQAKSYIDVVVDSLATGLAGFLLIFLIKKLNLETSYITVIVLLFLFLWVLLIYKLREAYFESFRINIQQSLINSENEIESLKKETTQKTTSRILSSGDEESILILLERLSDVKLKSLKTQIIALLDHPSNAVKASAINELHVYGKETAVDKVKELLNEAADYEVVSNALEYLVEHTNQNNESVFNAYLDHKNEFMANAALLCLAKTASYNSKLSKKFDLEQRIKNKISKNIYNANDKSSNVNISELMQTIAYSKISAFYSYIFENFSHHDDYIVRKAIKAAGISQGDIFIDTLVDFLEQKKYRKTTVRALKQYGESITKTLYTYDLEENLKDDVRKQIPKVVEVFRTQESVRVLFRLLKSKDVLVRHAAAKAMNKLMRKSAHLNFSQSKIFQLTLKESKYYENTLASINLLQSKISEFKSKETNGINNAYLNALKALEELLQLQLEQSLDNIFELLSLKYGKTDIHVAYSGLKSSKDSRINSLEFLDNLLHIKLKNSILPLLETYVIEEDMEREAPKFNNNGKTIYKCANMLLKNRGKRMKLAVISVAKYSEDIKYIKPLKTLLKHKNPIVRQAASEAINFLK